MARGRYIRTREHRGGAPRGESGRSPVSECPSRIGGHGRRERAQVDELIASRAFRRLLAFTELKFSNSMIEAWWRSLKHQWLFLHPLDSVATIRRLVAFYVHDTTTCLHIRRFEDRRPTRCTSAPGTPCPQT